MLDQSVVGGVVIPDEPDPELPEDLMDGPSPEPVLPGELPEGTTLTEI